MACIDLSGLVLICRILILILILPPNIWVLYSRSEAKMLLILPSLPRPSLAPLLMRSVLCNYWVYDMMAFAAHVLSIPGSNFQLNYIIYPKLLMNFVIFFFFWI